MDISRRGFLKGSIATVLYTLVVPGIVKPTPELIASVKNGSGMTLLIHPEVFEREFVREYFAKQLIENARYHLPGKIRIALMKGSILQEGLRGEDRIPFSWFTNNDIINGKVKSNDIMEIRTI